MSAKRIAVLGAGGHSQRHGRSLRRIAREHPGRIELTGVCDLDEARARKYAEKYGFARAWTDVAKMLADDRPDALVAVTAVRDTERIVAALLPAGVPLMIEKPAGVDSAAAGRLLRIARRARTPHAISYNRRVCPPLVRAREWIAAGGVGAPTFVLARMLRHGRLESDFITATGIHLTDTVMSLLGPAGRVDTRHAPAPTGRRTHYFARADHADGVAEMIVAPDAGTYEETYELHGPGYCIHVDTVTCSLRAILRGETALDWQADPDAEDIVRDGDVDEALAFVEMLEGRRDDLPTLADAVAGMRTAEAMAAGGCVKIAAPDDGE